MRDAKTIFFVILTIIPNMGNAIALSRFENKVLSTPLFNLKFNSASSRGSMKLYFQVFIVLCYSPCKTHTRDNTSIEFQNVAFCQNSHLSSPPRMGPCLKERSAVISKHHARSSIFSIIFVSHILN